MTMDEYLRLWAALCGLLAQVIGMVVMFRFSWRMLRAAFSKGPKP